MYHFRQVVDGDFDLLFEILRSTMQPYYVQAFGQWDDALERKYLADSLKEYRYEVIIFAGSIIGCWARREGASGIFLAEMQILPAYQSQGHGRRLLRRLLDEATQGQLCVQLEVLTVNERARRLYERLGFKVVGSTMTHHKMHWQPELNETGTI